MDDPKDPSFKVATFFEKTPDLVCIASKEGFFKKINPSVIEKLEYTEEELMSRPISSFVYPDDREHTKHERVAMLNGKALLSFQNRYVTKTGKIIWLEWTSIYHADEETVFAIAKDVTAKKQMEKEVEEKYIKFKSLTAHFKSSIEEDRKYLANELHEEMAQLVSVLKIDIDWITHSTLKLPETLKKRIGHVSIIADLLAKTIQRISFAISPSMLQDIGLNATLEWFCREFSMFNRVPCRFESAYDESALSEEIKTDFFRICQEFLTNVIDSSLAGSIIIRIDETPDKIYLFITEDGKGFVMNNEKPKPGLTRIRERVASINGIMTIETNKVEGTIVSVAITK